MKIKRLLCITLLILILSNLTANATPKIERHPISNTYTEGIYHFDKSIGTKISFRLLTEDKPINIIIINGNDFKYQIYLGGKTSKTDIYLDKPLNYHTVILVGEGEVSFNFEK